MNQNTMPQTKTQSHFVGLVIFRERPTCPGKADFLAISWRYDTGRHPEEDLFTQRQRIESERLENQTAQYKFIGGTNKARPGELPSQTGSAELKEEGGIFLSGSEIMNMKCHVEIIPKGDFHTQFFVLINASKIWRNWRECVRKTYLIERASKPRFETGIPRYDEILGPPEWYDPEWLLDDRMFPSHALPLQKAVEWIETNRPFDTPSV